MRRWLANPRVITLDKTAMQNDRRSRRSLDKTNYSEL